MTEPKGWQLIPWILLLVLAALLVAFPFLALSGILRRGIPTDHAPAYQALAGHAFPSGQSASPALYIRQLEYGYALHELTFGLLFLVIVAIPLRAGQRWGWWACWISLIAYVGYTATVARLSPTTLASSLVPPIGRPSLLVVQA